MYYIPARSGASNAFTRHMTLIERYLFRQILGPILAAVAALAAVALLSQGLRGLDLIVERGQSAWILIKVTALALPQLMTMILPIGVFVGALLSLNRLHTEQEIVVCFAGGMSRWRVISPAVRIAVFAALIALAVNIWVQPLASRTMREQLYAARTDLAATLVKEGEFVQASKGLTVYTQSIDQNGLLKNLFISVAGPDGQTVYTAQEGRITKNEGKPVLLMRYGSSQEFAKNGVLNFLSFDEYAFDLSPYMKNDIYLRYKTSDRWLHELFFPNLQDQWEQRDQLKLLAEGHARLSAPLYNITFMALALAAVVGGGFSRVGYGRRIAGAAGIAAVTRIVGFGILAACEDSAWLNILQYLVPAVTAWFAFRALFRQRVNRYVPVASDQGALMPSAS
ncbi:LPS export ABC transporter permease LptF [Caulobacter sp. 17J80-11]|uniref:LPS export ABC transporter permease LptF n=1 Tax=Caulobacter sp. 17J80-11 TaxID=2763502 RepID=UPI00351CB415